MNRFLFLRQTEEEFLADLTGQVDDEDQEEEADDFSESDEEEIEEQRERKAVTNGGQRRKGMESTVGKMPNVGTILRALQQEGEAFGLNSVLIKGFGGFNGCSFFSISCHIVFLDVWSSICF